MTAGVRFRQKYLDVSFLSPPLLMFSVYLYSIFYRETTLILTLPIRMYVHVDDQRIKYDSLEIWHL